MVLVPEVAHPVMLPLCDPIPQTASAQLLPPVLLHLLLPSLTALAVPSSEASEGRGDSEPQQERKEFGTRTRGRQLVVKDMACFHM